MAPQLRATNGLSARGEARWIASAHNSLPVPLSPVMKAGALEAAIADIRRCKSSIAADEPSMVTGWLTRFAEFEGLDCVWLVALLKVVIRRLRETGLTR
jgi:hypothetical protein